MVGGSPNLPNTIQSEPDSSVNFHADGFIPNVSKLSINSCACALVINDDSTNTAVISSTAVINKQVDATWAAGTGAGGNLSHAFAAAADGKLYLWVAMGSGVAGDADIGFWDVADTTTLANRVSAAGFTYYKVLGFRHLVAGPIWAGFTQRGDYLVGSKRSENVIASLAAAFAVVDHTDIIHEDTTDQILWGIEATSATTGAAELSIDGTNQAAYIGGNVDGDSDTVNAWHSSGYANINWFPYSSTLEFKYVTGTMDLLLHGVKFKR